MKERAWQRPIGVFTGGGTGGHVYPGLAVWERVSTWWPGTLIWIGANRGFERDLIRRLGHPYIGIPAGKLRRYWSLENLVDGFKVVMGFLRALVLFLRLRPVFVFSKGGFVTVPVVWAARLAGARVFSHESDLTPGLATRLNLPASEILFLPYRETLNRIPPRHRKRCQVSGNPVRSQLRGGEASRAESRWGIPHGKPMLLVLGGSSGSAQINRLIPAVSKALRGRLFVLHQTGPKGSATTEEGYITVPYLGPELADALARADVLVSRAGAGSLWEAALYRVPMILVPLAAGSRGDQILNARLWEARGCARVLIDPTASELTDAILRLLEDPDLLGRMREAYREIPLNAAERISETLQKLLLA